MSSQPPFLRALASSSRPEREEALSSLRLYLTTPNRTLTPIDHLKIWKGLFYCLFHTDRPLPQQSLCRSLASLLGSLPPHTFLAFVRAFWITMAEQWGAIPGLRLDKYLLLIRCYVADGFGYLATRGWEAMLLEGYLEVLREVPLSTGTQRGEGAVGNKVPDGLRYHVLDVWVDGLEGVAEDMVEGILGRFMEPIERVGREGWTKVLRQRAKDVLNDERLRKWQYGNAKKEEIDQVAGMEGEKAGLSNEDDWGGFED